MKPVKFKGMNCIYAGNQPQYLPLPAHKTESGLVTSCWQAGFIERIKLALSGKIMITVMTHNDPLQPYSVKL